MKKRICFVVSEIFSARILLKDHIDRLSEDFDVYLVANIPDAQVEIFDDFKIAGFKSVRIKRKLSIIDDIRSVFVLIRYFNRMNFFAVHSLTPKAGLITALASRISNVPNRIHMFSGQVWYTRTGLFKRILMFVDQIIVKCNTHNLVDGKTQRKFLVKHRILKYTNSIILGAGSITGVSLQRFTPSADVRKQVRLSLGLREDQIVFVFLGRLNRDKGIQELFEAFDLIYKDNKNVYLLLIGPDEENCLNNIYDYAHLIPGVNMAFFGYTLTPERLLQAGDVFCLPSYREGFGQSVIEASCLGLPVICSDTYGIMDAMVDDVTGLRCKVKDVESLYQQMLRLSDDSELRRTLGQNGRQRVLDNFSGEAITNAWVEFYRNL